MKPLRAPARSGTAPQSSSGMSAGTKAALAALVCVVLATASLATALVLTDPAPYGAPAANAPAQAAAAAAAAAAQVVDMSQASSSGNGSWVSRPLAPTFMGYSGKDIDAFFGGKSPPRDWLEAVTKDPMAAIASWQATLDHPGCWTERSQGWQGPAQLLLGNSNMEDWTLRLKVTPEWRKKVATEWQRILGPDGTPASGDGKRSWGNGYTFHLVRNRFSADDRLGKGSIALAWPGGPNGGGTRVMNSQVRRWCVLPPATDLGATEVTMKVNPAWLAKTSKKVQRAGEDKATFPAGLFIAWLDSRPSFHGSWDSLVWINQLYDNSKESIFVELTATEKKQFGAAIRNLKRLLESGADDRSGYNPGEMEQWRKSCIQELSKGGVKLCLTW